MTRKVVIYRTSYNDWVATCPSLPGCACRAKTKSDALDLIRLRIDEYIAELRAENAPIPADNVEVSVVLV